MYGPSDGRVLNEMSPTHPDTFYAQTKRAAEQIVLNARGADGQPLGTVLRLGAVYGSRIKGNYERLTRALAGNLGSNLGIIEGQSPYFLWIDRRMYDRILPSVLRKVR